MKKQILNTQTLGALGLGTGLFASMAWFYRALVHWNLAQYAAAIAVMAVGVILLTLLTLRARGVKKALGCVWKCALSVGVFLGLLIGVSYIVNNVMYRGAVLAGRMALLLCSLQVCALFALLLRGMAKGGKKTGAAAAGTLTLPALAAATLFVMLSGAEYAGLSREAYFEQLDGLGVYANAAQDALPQTAVFGIVMEHFEQEREDGRLPKALIIGYDGARADTPPLTRDDPNSGIQALVNGGGALYNMYCGGDAPLAQATSTSPGWTNLLTGRWARQPDGGGHGISDNGIVKAPDAPPILHTALLDRARAGKAALVISWDEYFAYPGAVWYNDKLYAEENDFNINWVNVPYDGDIVLFEAGLAQLGDPEMDFVMVTLDACDYAGHGGGFGRYNETYVDAFIASEHFAYDLIQAVKARDSYAREDWLIVIASDHGGVGKSHGAQMAEMRQTIFAVSKRLG